MLLSISLILLVGMSMSWICRKIKLPGLLGMLVTGIVLGPYMLDLLDESILGISSELRKIALIIILTRDRSVRAEKNRKTGSADVFCSCKSGNPWNDTAGPKAYGADCSGGSHYGGCTGGSFSCSCCTENG